MSAVGRRFRGISGCGLCLFLVAVSRPSVMAEDDAPADKAEASTLPGDAPADPPEGASEPGKKSMPPPQEPRREPSANEILDMLTPREGVPRPLVRPNVPGRPKATTLAPEAMPRNAVAPASDRLLPDGYRLVDRPGRLQREGDYWVLATESRSTSSTDAPLRLLPNRALEDMEIASKGGSEAVVFIVSGEITEYHGVNYLLVQKLLIRPNLGNLR